MMTQRKRGVFKLIKLSSLPTRTFILSSVLARMLIFVMITVLLVLLGRWLFGISVAIDGALIMILTTIVGCICFNSIGYIIASRASNEGMMNMISTLCSMPMIFLSSAFYSLDHAPQWIQFISKLNPFEYAIVIGKDAMIGEFNMQSGAVLLVFALISACIAVKAFRYE